MFLAMETLKEEKSSSSIAILL